MIEFSRREKQILDGIIEGRPQTVIAVEYHISPKTVSTHIARAMEKTGAESLGQLCVIYDRIKQETK